MLFTVLSSGSKGNCLLVQSGESCVMVEAGLGPRRLSTRLMSVGLNASGVTALAVTHSHHDHVKAAPDVAEALGIPTYATRACAIERAQHREPLWAHQLIKPAE